MTGDIEVCGGDELHYAPALVGRDRHVAALLSNAMGWIDLIKLVRVGGGRALTVFGADVTVNVTYANRRI
jgi:hypothetical protein